MLMGIFYFSDDPIYSNQFSGELYFQLHFLLVKCSRPGYLRSCSIVSLVLSCSKKFKSIIVRFWYIYRSGEGFELFKKDSNRLGRSLRLIGDNYMHYSPEIAQKFEIIGKKYKMRRERDSNSSHLNDSYLLKVN